MCDSRGCQSASIENSETNTRIRFIPSHPHVLDSLLSFCRFSAFRKRLLHTNRSCGFYRISLGVLILAMVGLSPSSFAQTPTAENSRCKELAQADFASVQDAPSQVVRAELVQRSSEHAAYCRVEGYVAPNVGFEMWLPTGGWNGKFLEIGCGGYCGHSFVSDWELGCGRPLSKGYACIASDMGHQGRGDDAVWALNNLQAEVDYGFRATHVTALIGKAITERFYSTVPRKSYYTGCSTGGRQGLVEAQRFPWDFDGIVAGAPAINLSATLLNILWASLAIEGRDGKPLFSQADLQVLHNAALAQCDMDDGLKDGIISNPQACRFDPQQLVCGGATKTNCLSAEQAEAAKKIYAGPTTSSGKQIFTSGAMPGAELEFLSYAGGSSFGRDFFRFLAFMPDAGPSWERRDFDFDRDYKRLGMVEALYGGTDPDLRRFKANGGKLILYHGWADAGGGGIAPLKTVDYYETVERAMGGRSSTREFLRFFMIPGMGHCAGGSGPNDFDYLSYLEHWIEDGHAPDKIVGTHIDFDRFVQAHESETNSDQEKLEAELRAYVQDPSNRSFSRPVYLYPAYAKFKGEGDPNSEGSFVASEGK